MNMKKGEKGDEKERWVDELVDAWVLGWVLNYVWVGLGISFGNQLMIIYLYTENFISSILLELPHTPDIRFNSNYLKCIDWLTSHVMYVSVRHAQGPGKVFQLTNTQPHQMTTQYSPVYRRAIRQSVVYLVTWAVWSRLSLLQVTLW